MERLDDLRSINRSIGRIARLTTGRTATRARAEVSGVGLSRPSLAIMSCLHSSGALRLTALARLVDLEAPLVSREVRELCDAGLLVRTADPEDGRASIVELTPLGVETWQRHRDAVDAMTLAAFVDWSADDLRSFRALLERAVEVALRVSGAPAPDGSRIVAGHDA